SDVCSSDLHRVDLLRGDRVGGAGGQGDGVVAGVSPGLGGLGTKGAAPFHDVAVCAGHEGDTGEVDGALTPRQPGGVGGTGAPDTSVVRGAGGGQFFVDEHAGAVTEFDGAQVQPRVHGGRTPGQGSGDLVGIGRLPFGPGQGRVGRPCGGQQQF